MEAVLKKLIGELYGKWRSIPIVVCVSAIVYLSILNGLRENENVEILGAILLISIIALNVIYFIIVNENYYIKRVPKNKVGVLIDIDADDVKIYREIKRKFGEELEKNIYGNFVVIYVPCNRRIGYLKPEEQKKNLYRKRGLLLLKIKMNVDSKDQSLLYDMQVGAMMLHRHYQENIKEVFENEFRGQLKPVSRLEFEPDEMIKKLRIRAVEMSLICNYVIGFSLFLNGNIVYARVILENVSKTLKEWNKVDDIMVKRVDVLVHQILIWEALLYGEYYHYNPDELVLIERMKEMLEKSNEYISNTPNYFLNRAYCDVILGDIENAKKMINLCKQKNTKNLSWKYSEAFLAAYENKSTSRIITLYRSALKIPYDIQDLIIYIETTLEREHKIGLLLAVAILYDEIGNVELAKEYFEKYIIAQADQEKTKDLLRRKGFSID